MGGALGKVGQRVRDGQEEVEGFDLRHSNATDCHSQRCKSVAKGNEFKWTPNERPLKVSGQFWRSFVSV